MLLSKYNVWLQTLIQKTKHLFNTTTHNYNPLASHCFAIDCIYLPFMCSCIFYEVSYKIQLSNVSKVCVEDSLVWFAFYNP